MSNKTFKIIGIVLFVLVLAASVYGYFHLPELVTVSIFGEKPVGAWVILLAVGLLIGLCLYRLIQSPIEKVSLQILIIMAVLVVLDVIFIVSYIK